MKKSITTFILILVSIVGANAQDWNEMIKLVSSDRAVDDYLGYTVSIDGDRAAVTAILEDENVSGNNTMESAGAVYIFEMNNGVWMESAKLVASDRGADDRFGSRVSLDGDRIIIGAFQEDEDVFGGATLTDAGSAYIFDLVGNVWTETAKLVASDRAVGSRFGFDVDLNGEKALIGAYQNATNESGGLPLPGSGAVYAFELIGGVWVETQKIVASDRSGSYLFGYSLSMNENTAVIGSYRNAYDALGLNPMSESGAAYVFEHVGGVWLETEKLVASDRWNGDWFGFNVSISDKIVIGAPKEDHGASGGNTANNAGSVYVFELDGGVWTETAKLTSSDREENDEFGRSTAISGNTLIVGAQFEDEDLFGGNNAASSGSAYVYELVGGSWTEISKLVASDRGADDRFGSSVDISGNKVIIGAVFSDDDELNSNFLNDAGSIYVFNTCYNDPPIFLNGSTLTTSVTGVYYQWYDCDTDAVIVSENGETYVPTVDGNYAVIITEGNCVDTSQCLTVSNVGIKDSEGLSNFLIYPNPVKNQLKFNGIELVEEITILNSQGKTIEKIKDVNHTIDVSNLENGVYILLIESNLGISAIKFIKD